MGDDAALITSSDLERCLEHVQATAPGPREGVFGPASALWHVNREAVLFVGAGRALLMQLAHPWVATAISAHSTALDDPVGRFHRTFEIVFKLVFGSSNQALATARRLHRLHAAVRGSMPERLGPYAEGAPYFANEVSAVQWVHATLVDTALVAYELVRPPLEPEMRERYYGESRKLGALFGIPPDAQPLDAPAFANYMGSMLSSEALAVGADARRMGLRVLSGAGRVWVPGWYRDLTAALIPEPLRSAFELPFGEQERRRATQAMNLIRRLYPALPARLRYVAPYQEALSRLCGRQQPDLLTRTLNRLWIGRSSISD
jgi:uncharacterized protein (DUF2236 family)